MVSSVNSSLTNTASSDSPVSESSSQSNQFENTSSAITSQRMAVTSVAASIGPMMLEVIDDDEEPPFRPFNYEPQPMALTSIVAVSAPIGPMMLEVIDDDEEPPFRPFNYEPQPKALTPIAAVSASIGATLEVIDDDEEPPFRPFYNGPTHPTSEETMAVMETTTLAEVDAPPNAPFISEKIEDGDAESEEEDSIVVPPTLMLEDEREAQCKSTFTRLGQDLLVVDHRGNDGSDDPSQDPVNHNDDRSSDSTFRVPASALLTELEPEEVITAIQPEPWCKQNPPRLLILCAAIVVVVTVAIVLVSTLDMSNESYGVFNSVAPSSEPSLPPLVQ